MTTRLIPFYRGESPGSEDRWLRDLRAWGYRRLENVHDYIQWLFPTRQRNALNPGAPTMGSNL